MALSHALLGVGVGLFGVLALEPPPHPQSNAAAQSRSAKCRLLITLMFPPGILRVLLSPNLVHYVRGRRYYRGRCARTLAKNRSKRDR